jgi:polyvinyl alcohol dehydrogenase (cytochrome)
MPWQTILAALEPGGKMEAMAQGVSDADKLAVARYLGKAGPVVQAEMAGECAPGARPQPTRAAWNGWSPDLLNTRFQTAEAAGLTAADVPNLKLKWAFGFPNATYAYSQPTIVNGKVYTGSNDGTVFALDARSGCIYWWYQAKALVRSAPIVGLDNRVYFGDLESNFYAVQDATGELVWQKKLDSQPFTRITGTAILHDGRLYVPITSQEENAGANPVYSCCTFRGNIVTIRASDGGEIWRTFTTPEPRPTGKNSKGVQFFGPSGATIWSAPTLDLKRKTVYIATGNGYSGPEIDTADAVMALDMDTGKVKWKHQVGSDMFNWGCGRGGVPDTNCPENAGIDIDLGGSPVLVDVGEGKQVLVQGRKSATLHGLDPDTGKQIWEVRFGRGGAGGGIQWGIAAGDGMVFAGLGEDIAGRARNGAEPPPLPADAVGNGGLLAFDPATGKMIWNTPMPAGTCEGKRGCQPSLKSPAAAIPGVVFAAGGDGHLRAYESKTGRVIWDFDAARSFPTVNGIEANGGSTVATGPTIANGMVYINSGSSMPGNALLAFGVE